MADIIQLLPDSVANQIAAGEVIQRPASAVKELMENAIDAGASAIELIIKDGGRTLIQVIDNGCGMSETDARLSFERHATSKIRAANDLFHIQTMGFRGEALASIAAIAHVEMKSKLHDNELGTQILIEGSEVKEQNVCQCRNGTSIAVKNLFFNVPARRNFLKSDTVELGHIEEEFKRIALINPEIAFTFHHNGKLLYKLEKSNFLQRIINIFGDKYKERLLPTSQDTNIINISGYVSKAEYAKKTRGEQYFFVNKRFIKHPYLHHAVENAFNELLPEKHYPSYFLCLEIDPSEIDINIHPTKTEIKFADEKSIYAILRSTVKKALGFFCVSPQIEFDKDPRFDILAPPKGYIPKAPTIHINPDFNPFEATTQSSKGQALGSFGKSHSEIKREQSNKDNWQKIFEDTDSLLPEKPLKLFQDEQEDIFPEKENEMAVNAFAIQIQNKYIVTGLKSGLVIIDQQRAHERILYEQFLQSVHTQAVSQRLLFPVSCNFSPANSEILNEISPDLKTLGFDIDAFGQNTFVIQGAPENVNQSELTETIEKMIEDYKSALIQKFPNKKENVAASMAKQLAIKSGKRLSQEEMQSIIGQIFACQMPDVSPSGKKVLAFYNEEMLNEKFK